MNLYTIIYIRTHNLVYMPSIITTSQVQQKIGEITANIGKKSYIVTNRGEGKMIILPYFDGCDKWMDDYMEDYEMYMNQDKIRKDLEESEASGISDFKI